MKPAVLYHASENRHITEFEPRAESIRDPLEGPVIFATSDKAYASAFIISTNDSWVTIGRFSTEKGPGPWHVIISDRDRFTELDHGGSIYSMPADKFQNDPAKNMGAMEWTSREAITPTGQEDYGSGLVAMKSLGVNVYFVDRETFAKIKSARDHAQSILDGLIPEA